MDAFYVFCNDFDKDSLHSGVGLGGLKSRTILRICIKKMPCRAEVGINLALVLPLLHITFLSETDLESTCFGAYFDTKFIHIQHNLASD